MTQATTIVSASKAGVRIRTLEDVSDLIGAAFGADGLLLTEADLEPAFFDLRTGIAGELFQKVTNYRIRLALVVSDVHSHGSRFAELAFEHRRHNAIRFFATRDDALAWLSG
jgi:hypothetical protein